jgi:DNA-binding transcriptional LysR family regulator
MELRHLRYFAAVAEEENVSRAALRLHVSQPALSRQIRDLEDELGFPLLERSAKSVRLTDAGRVFYDEAQAVLRRAVEAVKTARAVADGDRGELHIGYAPSLTPHILPPALRAFQRVAPGLRVALHDLSTGEMIARLQDGRLQIAFHVQPSQRMLRGLRFEKLAEVRLCLAVSPGHRLARRRRVTMEDASHEPLIAYTRSEYPEYHDFLKELFPNTKLHIAEEHDGVNSLIAAVEAGAGVAVAPETLACFSGPRLKLLPLTPGPRPLVIGAAWPKENLIRQAAQFLECAREVSETHP